MSCSIVVRAYNESAHLGRLLEGIARQSRKDVEVIVVDSGSTDSTVEIARSYGARIVSISPQEFTFGRSLNLGIRSASAELVVIASAHVYPVYPDWLECILSPFGDDDVALVYGKQRGTLSSKYSEHQIFHQWFPDTGIRKELGPFCNNANAAIRRSLWEQHPFDETLTGLEDIAWAKWVQSQGRAVVYAAHAEIVHIHRETPRRVYDRYRREAMAFKRIFPESHFSIYDCVRLALMNALGDLAHARRERVLRRNFIPVLWFRAAQFWGTYQGYRHASAVTRELRERFYYPRQPEQHGVYRRDMEPIRYNGSAPDPDAGIPDESNEI